MKGKTELYYDILLSYKQRNGPSLPRQEFARSQLEKRVKELAGILHSNALISYLLEENKNHDIESYYHMLRVGVSYDCVVQLNPELVSLIPKSSLGVVGFIHDAGKKYIPGNVLKKPGRLDEYEIEIMKCHNRLSVILLKKLEPMFPGITEIGSRHHLYPRTGCERRKGKRRRFVFDIEYDERLCTDRRKRERRDYDPQIEAASRLLAICDIFDALSSPRVYKESWGRGDVRIELEKEFSQHKEAIQQLYLMFPRNA